MRRLSVALMAAVLGVASAQGATLVSGWENSTEGWTVTDATFSTTTGVTEGNYALAFVAPNAWDWPVRIGNWNTTSFAILNEAQKTGAAIQLDVTLSTPMDGIDDWFSVSGWVWNGVGTGNFAMPGQGLQNVLTPQTITIPLTAGLGGPDGAGEGLGPVEWTQFRIVTQAANGYEPGTVYFDNLRVVAVPEPTSMALLGLGAIGLLARRKA